MGDELFHADGKTDGGWTDRHGQTNKPFKQFWERA